MKIWRPHSSSFPKRFERNPPADGYEIKVTLKLFKNQYIYLGHYYDKQLPVIDLVMPDANSAAVPRFLESAPARSFLQESMREFAGNLALHPAGFVQGRARQGSLV